MKKERKKEDELEFFFSLAFRGGARRKTAQAVEAMTQAKA